MLPFPGSCLTRSSCLDHRVENCKNSWREIHKTICCYTEKQVSFEYVVAWSSIKENQRNKEKGGLIFAIENIFIIAFTTENIFNSVSIGQLADGVRALDFKPDDPRLFLVNERVPPPKISQNHVFIFVTLLIIKYQVGTEEGHIYMATTEYSSSYLVNIYFLASLLENAALTSSKTIQFILAPI